MPQMGDLAAQNNYGAVDWSRMNQPFGQLFDPNPKLYDTKAGPIYQGDISQAIDVAMGFSGGGLVTKGIKAYHGSPHDFDRFDLSKIGTGEGAQSYGHGLYFAEQEGVAKRYRDKLAGDKGKMYEVNINADPLHFLDWDKPLTQQHPKVIDAVKQAMGPNWDQFKFAKAGDAVKQGFLAPSEEATAALLRNNGVPGIKYLDQGSRGAGQGTNNYAVLNPEIIDILRKYGIAGAAPAGMGALFAQDNYQPQEKM